MAEISVAVMDRYQQLLFRWIKRIVTLIVIGLATVVAILALLTVVHGEFPTPTVFNAIAMLAAIIIIKVIMYMGVRDWQANAEMELELMARNAANKAVKEVQHNLAEEELVVED
jgi:steroid 5-alpha reductase family enzyme